VNFERSSDATLFLINYPSNLRIVNTFFLVGFALFVAIPGIVGLAIVDEFLSNALVAEIVGELALLKSSSGDRIRA